jgi:thiol:disulfide interchange protein DsbD
MGKELSLKLPHAAALKPHPQHGPALEKFLATKFPKPMDGWSAVAYQNPKNWLLAIQPPAGTAFPETVHFLNEEKAVVDAQRPHVVTNAEGKWFISAPKHEDLDPKAAPKSLSGLLMIGAGEAAQAIEIKAELSTEPPPRFDGDGTESLPLLLWFAFLGGLILNLMPCVFPVIGIKIMDFVKQSGEERWKVKVHGLIFSLGILITFWILSAIFLILRSRGEGVGWGFQLQNPWVVYSLMLVMFVFALNMYGVFEIGTAAVGVGQNLAGKKGFVGSFFKGALAVVVSTPCSAPFLATALSAVISLPPAQMFLVFTFIALGLAAPYLILTASPALLKLLPKPGAWMEAFKQIMSFLMFGTAGYLLWIYGGLVEESNMLYAILGLTAVGLALYIHGKWNSLLSERKTRIKAICAAVLLAGGGIYLGYPKPNPLKWEPWTKAREQELVQEGKPVYIDFTARWCATCQTNKISYKSQAVYDAVATKGIVLLKADWTDHNNEIRKEMEGYNRSAIPVNVLLIPGAKEPEILPNILTTDVVMEYFNKVPEPSKEKE